MKEDIDVLLELRLQLKMILSRTEWNSILYTVPGSLEKVIEAKGSIIDAHKRAEKAIAFIENKKLEEKNNEDTQEG